MDLRIRDFNSALEFLNPFLEGFLNESESDDLDCSDVEQSEVS